MAYDPKKAHEYYERVKKLKGRQTKGASSPPNAHPKTAATTPHNKASKKPEVTLSQQTKIVKARVGRLKAKKAKLEGALTKAEQALSEKRRTAAKTKKANSDGKTTAKERAQSKAYREKHQSEIASKRKKASSSSSSGGSSANDVASMTVPQLTARIGKIHSALKDAKKQLAQATSQLGSLAHSDIMAVELESNGFALLHSITSRKESVKMTADFGGYATRNDVVCSDGRTILQDAFKENDGAMVPLVFQHGHKSIDNILGYCKLENRPDGVYAHAYFNDTAAGQTAKKQVQHGDLKFLSIFANQLKERVKSGVANAREVMQGNIREVSLVIAGANPGAYIDNVSFAHADGTPDYDESEATICYYSEIELEHADTKSDDDKSDDKNDAPEEDRTLAEILDTFNEEQTNAVEYLLSQALSTAGGDVKHSDSDEEDSEDAEDDSSDEDSDDVEADVDEDSDETEDGDSEEDADEDTDDADEDSDADAADSTETEAGADVQHDNNSQEDNSMTHNVFDQAKLNGTATGPARATLSHDDMKVIIRDTLRTGSLKAAIEDYVEHTGIMVGGELSHGIENIDYLFPDSKLLDNSPNFLSRRMEWVDKVLTGVRKTPFARIKTVTADITADEARAKGYIKGNMKNEEFFTLIKRETTPQTVYKKQKLDRDDVLDITDLDVIAWVKAEMKVMLDEEIAGAILIGDARSNASEEKIKEDKIRPIAFDAELYTTTVNVNLADASSSVEELIDSVIANRTFYKGTGMPTFYTSEDIIAKFLTVKDGFGHRLYKTLADVAAAMRVADIVSVDVMARHPEIAGIMVNLADYSIGTDRGGQATMFDDFDLDYNKLRYLLETRLCGALTLPKSAVVFHLQESTDAVLPQPTAPTVVGNTITVPTVTSVTYKNADTNATLVTGTPITLTVGQELNVVAVPAAGKYFPDSTQDQWHYEYKA